MLCGVRFLLIALILTHEIGHALVCRLIDVEVDFLAVSLLMGICAYSHWEDEPDERDFILIAWGGVFAQIVLLVPCLLGFALLTGSVFMPSYIRPDGFGFAHMTWVILIGLNVATILMNLVPLYPFDGEKAWEMTPWRVVRAMWYGWNMKQR